MTRPIHYVSQEAVEAFLDCGYDVGTGRDASGDYEFVVTAEGTEWRARLAGVAS